jgi:tetratricopeptide (TPR) repeat protein
LNKAALLAKKRDYDGALRILKDEEDKYYGSYKYYYLYGVICLHAGNLVEAHEFFNHARKIKQKDTSLMLGFAVLYLKRMNTVQAVEYYLNVQEVDPKNRIAKKALTIIRKYSSSEALSDWITFERLTKLFPSIPAPLITAKTVINISLVLVLAIFVGFVVLTGISVLPNPFAKNQRQTAEFILSGDDRKNPVEVGGFYSYILTREQAIRLYDRALALFTSYRDEAAKINLNRILESNASEGLKDRARLLINNMEVPGFDNFRMEDNPSYSAVKSEPVIYRDVHVVWSGMASNVEVTDEQTTFHLLVGYDTRRTLDGIVKVVFYGPVAVNTERPLRVLGRIVLTQDDIMLEGVAIHQSGRLDVN